jgi:hypothetical protein
MMKEVVEVEEVINTLVYVYMYRVGVECCLMIQVSSVEMMVEWGCMNGRPRQMVEQKTEQTTECDSGI